MQVFQLETSASGRGAKHKCVFLKPALFKGHILSSVLSPPQCITQLFQKPRKSEL